jgi:hypothetical protein
LLRGVEDLEEADEPGQLKDLAGQAVESAE